MIVKKISTSNEHSIYVFLHDDDDDDDDDDDEEEEEEEEEEDDLLRNFQIYLFSTLI